MKLFFLTCALMLTFGLKSQSTKLERQNKVPVAPVKNAASEGRSTMDGVGDGPLGPNQEEKKEVRKRAGSMGGAPKMGAGMGTGAGPKTRKTNRDPLRQ